MDDDLILAQLMCSRLCHDLVGPAGGVGAGLELFRDQGGGDDAALDLAQRSAGEVTRRLAFYRAAFGFGGGNDGTVAVAALRRDAARLFEGGKVALDWPDPGDGPAVPAVAGKLILTLVLIAADALGRGGRVAVGLAHLEDGLGVAVAARGPGAAVREEVAGALAGELTLDRVSARGITGFLARRLARSLAAELELDTSADEPRLALLIPMVD
ncbi:MAG: hypothetical protein H6907_12775 [Hyphomicrobiales bacterium]|nr:hypothetical protein [Hyphomicrobiales bacterium]MCP5372597.1 hypothetical protein [Hyphomicrobiales bacterium]